jgi:hypothetical protein
VVEAMPSVLSPWSVLQGLELRAAGAFGGVP